MITLGRPVRRSELGRAQAAVWSAHGRDPLSSAYHEPFVLTFDGPLDTAALEEAVRHLIERHEILRSTYERVDGRPLQITRELADAILPVANDANFAGLVDVPFDLIRDAPIRFALSRPGADRHDLLVVRHHVATDGWSLNILLGELRDLYAAALGLAAVPPRPAQFADLVAREHTGAGIDRADAALRWWLDHLNNCPARIELPAPDPGQLAPPARAVAERTVDATIVTRVRQRASDAGVSPFSWLAAATAMALARWHPVGPVPLGAAVSGRSGTADESVMGCFSSVLTLRTEVRPGQRLRGLVRETADELVGALAHGQVDPVALAAKRGTPNVVLVFQDLPAAAASARDPIDGVTITMRRAMPAATKYDLVVTVTPSPDGRWAIDARCRGDRVAGDVVETICSDVAGALSASVDPVGGSGLGAGPTLARLAAALWSHSDPAAHLPVRAWPEGSEAVVRGSTVLAALADRARQAPDAVAVRNGSQHTSMRGLLIQAGRIATALPSDLELETPIVTWLPRGSDLIAAALAVQSRGAVPVPQDRHTPWSVTARIRDRCGASLVITDAAGAEEADAAASILDATGVTDLAAVPVRSSANRAGREQQAAYVVYTSGSTGEPKGVVVSQRSVLDLVAETADLVPRNRGCRWSWVHSPAFDFSVWETWAALLHGAEVVVVPSELAADPGRLRDRLVLDRVDVLSQTPAAFTRLAAVWGEHTGRPGLVVLGGEQCLPNSFAGWFGSGRRVINMFGISETTVHATAQVLDEPWTRTDALSPVGALLAGRTGRLVDRFGLPAPAGAVGELILGGNGVARGYLGRPDLTATAFTAAPAGGRAYRSGDLLALRSRAALDYRSRRDAQISFRGYRIEPGEVRAALLRSGGVRDAAVGISGTGTSAVLCAWVVPAGADVDPRRLRRALAAELPAHLVPGAFVVLDELPTTANGKLARERLPTATIGSGLVQVTEAQTDLERGLADVWHEITGGTRPGLDDRFIDIGAHSLVMVRLADRLTRSYGVTLGLDQLARIPTLRDLAEVVETTLARDGGTAVDLGALAEALRPALRGQP